ncbi:hypothetical protein HCU64_22585 [Methylobacterium sp. C25]|uniref:DUF6894 family protein n=1 Tax=Methylobacterium sp. C25 TaxID=2721622 RepID=UPI001F206196|nr:hypothetical protein [Methylobacterium sp. C25]MCE4226534.1 hypothetical protein [Methylobacterium sp. C25]
MTSRYYFDAEKDGEVIRDECGVEADNISEIVEQAELGLEELRETLKLGEAEGWTIVVRDDRNTKLLRLSI